MLARPASCPLDKCAAGGLCSAGGVSSSGVAAEVMQMMRRELPGILNAELTSIWGKLHEHGSTLQQLRRCINQQQQASACSSGAAALMASAAAVVPVALSAGLMDVASAGSRYITMAGDDLHVGAAQAAGHLAATVTEPPVSNSAVLGVLCTEPAIAASASAQAMEHQVADNEGVLGRAGSFTSSSCHHWLQPARARADRRCCSSQCSACRVRVSVSKDCRRAVDCTYTCSTCSSNIASAAMATTAARLAYQSACRTGSNS